MPLLKRQPFVKQKLPPDLDPDEELFFCKLTKEVFRDYDEFFERVILCNSLVWTCELTGRPGLTYQEALESEGRARRCLKSFPDSLKIPVLYLSTLTHRGRLADMCDDVYGFARERFFVGEEIEGVVDGQRIPCEVVKVVASSPNACNGFHGEDDSANGTRLEKNTPAVNESEKKKQYGPHPSHYQYHLVTLDDDDKKHILTYNSILRKKGVFTREKIKLFLKQYCEPRDGIWKLKKSIEKKCNIAVISFTDVFAGPLPKFVQSLSSKAANRPTKSGKAKSTLNGSHASAKGKSDTKKGGRESKNKPISIDDIKEMRKQLENRQKMKEEEKQKRKEEKEKEREKKREERRLKAEILREWQRPRDDLECDDLKAIPALSAVNCSFQNELFGDAVMVLEFINTFGDLFKFDDAFPQGFGFDHLEKALVETDIRGPLGDILQFFMQAIFNLQEDEEFAMENYSLQSPDIPEGCDDESDLTTVQALQTATAAAAWPQRHQGLSLKKLALDPFTISEVLRLHFLSFGSQFACVKWHQQLKGAYSVFDDPALQLRLRDPNLLKALSARTVFEFNSAERLQILHLLINQLLNFLAVRYHIEENIEKVRNARIDLKQMQWAEQRKEKEEAALRLQKKTESKDDDKNEESNGDNHEAEEPKTKKRKNSDAQKKQDNLRKRELKDIIGRLQSCGGVQPLGRDRAYRRFWLFESIPGLYVEDDDEFVGQCLSNPTPVKREEIALENTEVQLDEKTILSDKENEELNAGNSETALPPTQKNHKLLSDNHPTDKINNNNVSNIITMDVSIDGDNIAEEKFNGSTNSKEMHEEIDDEKLLSKTKQFMDKCTANIDNCPIHNRGHYNNKRRWYFVSSLEEFDSLLVALNQRGFRESSLKDALYHDKPRIVQSILQCPVQKLNPDKAIDVQHPHETRKIARLNGIPISTSEISSEEGMEIALRDMLVDIEERIYAGSLGCIKVINRELWRKAIQEKGYDMQCEGGLKWGQRVEVTQVDQDSDSGRGTPIDLSEQEVTLQRSHSPLLVNQVVKDMASALLQIAQGVEIKYMRPPLGEDTENKKQKIKPTDTKKAKKETVKEDDAVDKDNGDKELKTKPQKTVYMRWEESLMTCTNFSQVFIHLATLERSIEWSRSVLNARCRICHRRGDAERMLLCDECNRGHHTYCLKPPLLEIPPGDWFCLDCRPRTKVPPPPARKPARRITYTDDEDDDMELQENSSEFDGDSNFTLRDENDDFEEDEESEENNDDTCDYCERGGHLICCDSCPSAFHLECVDPPLRRVPKGRWECPNCSYKPDTSENVKDRLRNHGKRAASEVAESSPAKRTRSRDRPIVEEDEIWMIGRKKHGPAVRRGASRDAPVDYKFCDQMLMEMSRNECSWPFMRPVGRKQVPVYYEVIKRPIDLATMRFKLNNMEYRSTKHFLMDVLLLIQNCIMYNALDSNEYSAAVDLLKFVEHYSLDVGFAGLGDLLEHSSCPSSPSSPQPSLPRRPESKMDVA